MLPRQPIRVGAVVCSLEAWGQIFNGYCLGWADPLP